ncbi:MAG: S9 family peptidase [Gemmatimonadales bacterium]
MSRSIRLASLVALLCVGASVRPCVSRAQVPESVRAAVHRIFATRDFASERFGPARWIENGAAYTTVEPVQGGRGFEIVRYETATGARSILVSGRQLTPSGDSVPLDFDDYSWSDDHNLLLLFTNTQRVWRANTRGDYWVLDRRGGALKKLGGDGPASTLMYAKIAPQGDRVAYVRQGEVYVEGLSDGRITRLTSGATTNLVNGMTDWVYEEEFGLRDGFRWSPDGTRIAYWQFDMTGVPTFLLINDTDSLYPFTVPIQYPKVGTTNSAVRVGVVSASGGETTWIQVPGDMRDNYIPWMEWAGPTELVIQHINRRQNEDDVLMADAASGAVRAVLAERDSAWVNDAASIPWLESGRRFLWTSERDGWRHLYTVSRDGRDVRLVTPGEFDVAGGVHVDEAGGFVYYIASPTSAVDRYLYRSRLDGRGAAERVTPEGFAGSHSYNVSPDVHWAFHSQSNFDTPPVIELVRLPQHQSVRPLVRNEALRTAVRPLIARPVEYFRVPVGNGLTVDGWMIRPRDFDSTKTYPMLVDVYGEPAGQTTVNGWGGGGTLWNHMLADQGYLVVSFDNQGTPAPRGRVWRKIVYGQVGVLSSHQQAEAVRALERTRPYVDATRVGIWGWSGGGSSTLQAMFRYPDVYQMGMSVAAVPDEKLYDTIYQERYMGLLPDMAAAYDSASAISHADGLRGSLLIVHGSGDDNVHYQGDERLVNRLVSLGKPFDLMVYPNRSHCICEGRGTTEHVYQLLTRYLLTHLPAGGR